MNITAFRTVIKERQRIAEECQDEWDYGIKQCWKQEIELLSEDIPSSIAFLVEECSAEEFSWISEVIDDIVEKTQSREFLDCYKKLAVKYQDECKEYNIAGSIKIAEDILELTEKSGRTKS